MPGIVLSEPAGLSPAGTVVQAAGTVLQASALTEMLGDVACAVTGPIGWRERDVAAALAPYMGRTGLLDGVECPGEPEDTPVTCYTVAMVTRCWHWSGARDRCRRCTPISRGAFLVFIRAG